jgi:hypothetical protein
MRTDPPATPEPVFVLGPGRSFTSVVSTCLGQHPQLYGLPETNLFLWNTMWDWWQRQGAGRAPDAHGLLRTVAEVVYGEQSARTVMLARLWIRRRLAQTPSEVLREIAGSVHPRRLVEKSPRTSAHPRRLQALDLAFPRASFIHVVRSPIEQTRSIVAFAAEVGVPRQSLAGWLAAGGDPYARWYQFNSNILSFLETVPEQRWVRVRGEDVLRDPARSLAALADRLCLRADAEAVEEMLHPERSPFARFGPPGAEIGNDPHFLHDPRLRTAPGAPADRSGDFTIGPPPEEVSRLAVELGYPVA